MRKTVAKKIWKLAASMAKTSSLTKTPDGAVRWEGFARLYKDMKKAYKVGK
jgi:hypothetical protein